MLFLESLFVYGEGGVFYDGGGSGIKIIFYYGVMRVIKFFYGFFVFVVNDFVEGFIIILEFYLFLLFFIVCIFREM